MQSLNKMTETLKHVIKGLMKKLRQTQQMATSFQRHFRSDVIMHIQNEVITK